MPQPFAPFAASAPGKIILLGEHAVVHGTHAIATVVDRRAVATFAPAAVGSDTVTLTIDAAKGTSFEWAWPLAALQSFAAELAAEPRDSDAERNALVDRVQQQCAARAELFGYDSAALAAAQAADAPAQADLRRTLGQAPAHVFVMLFVLLFGAKHAVSVRVASNLPMGAGMGSSAAVSGALAAGFYRLADAATDCSTPVPATGASPCSAGRATINQWAFQGERLIHGNPSGVDNTCAVYGGVIAYRRLPGGGQHVSFLPAGCIPASVAVLVTDTKVPKDTKALVAKVGRLKQALPEVIAPMLLAFDALALRLLSATKRYCAATGRAVDAGVPSSAEADAETADDTAATTTAEDEAAAAAAWVAATTPLLTVCQSLLNAVGVGHAALDAVVEASRALGLAAKLTGAGGGGCAITLVPAGGDADALEAALRPRGYECLRTQIGQDGVRYEPAAAQ